MFANESRFDPLISAAIARWAPHYGVTIPTWLVQGIIARESSFRYPTPTRREADGRVSRGLMQVLEDTARWLGLSDVKRLDDPAEGINRGVQYLAYQLRRYAGNVEKAVAAYNAGSVGATIPNRSYVDAVLGFAHYFASKARAAAPYLAAGLALAVLLLLRRKRGRS